MLRTAKYTHGDDYLCLEDLRGVSTEITLVHMGKESCKPYHVFSGTREEYIIHFILSGRGFYSANGNTWSLSSGQMFLVQTKEEDFIDIYLKRLEKERDMNKKLQILNSKAVI